MSQILNIIRRASNSKPLPQSFQNTLSALAASDKPVQKTNSRSYSTVIKQHSARRISTKPRPVSRRYSNYIASNANILETEQKIESLITDNLCHGKVVMWSLGDKCIHTGKQNQKVKKILDDFQIEYTEHKLNEMDLEEQSMVRTALNLETGYTQFPNIFFGTEHVGGQDDLIGYLHSQNIFEDLMNKNGIQSSSGTDMTEEETRGTESVRSPITPAMERFEETPETFAEFAIQQNQRRASESIKHACM